MTHSKHIINPLSKKVERVYSIHITKLDEHYPCNNVWVFYWGPERDLALAYTGDLCRRQSALGYEYTPVNNSFIEFLSGPITDLVSCGIRLKRRPLKFTQ